MTPSQGSRMRWIPLVLVSALVISLPVESRAAPLRFTEFPAGVDSTPQGIASGPDGNLWFSEYSAGKIGRITPSGSLSEFNIPSGRLGSAPIGIVSGPDGNLWFAEASKIGRITPSGVITEFPVPTLSQIIGIAAGSDGNLWFTETSVNQIGRITTQGVVSEFPGPSSGPWGIAPGTDGALWFTEPGANKIGRMTTAGSITEFTVPTASSNPRGIALGPDGNLWFTEYLTGKIGRISPQGSFIEFTVNGGSGRPFTISAGPDGNMWFNDPGKIGRITMAGSVTEFAIAYQGPIYGITAGPDGNVWLTEFDSSKIARVIPPTSDLSASMVADPNPVHHGQNLTYTITVTNGGLDDAIPVRSVQSPPTESTFVSANPSQGTCVTPAVGATGDVSCSLGTIPTGASATIEVVVTVTASAGHAVESHVTTSSDGTDPNPANNSASVTTDVASSSADLGISMSATPNRVRRYRNLTYTVPVTNAGPDPAALVTVVQQLPAQSRFVSATASQGSCITPAPGATGNVRCSLGDIVSGGSATITVVVSVTAPDRSRVQSTAGVISEVADPDFGNNSAAVTTRVCNFVFLGLCI